MKTVWKMQKAEAVTQQLPGCSPYIVSNYASSLQLSQLQKMLGTFLSSLCVCGLRRRFFGSEESATDQAVENVVDISFKLMRLRTAKKVFQGWRVRNWPGWKKCWEHFFHAYAFADCEEGFSEVKSPQLTWLEKMSGTFLQSLLIADCRKSFLEVSIHS